MSVHCEDRNRRLRRAGEAFPERWLVNLIYRAFSVFTFGCLTSGQEANRYKKYRNNYKIYANWKTQAFGLGQDLKWNLE